MTSLSCSKGLPQTFEQIEYIPIIEIKSSAIDVNPFGQLAHSDILHLFMLHQFNQPLTEHLFCASNPTIPLFFSVPFSVFISFMFISASFSTHF